MNKPVETLSSLKQYFAFQDQLPFYQDHAYHGTFVLHGSSLHVLILVFPFYLSLVFQLFLKHFPKLIEKFGYLTRK